MHGELMKLKKLTFVLILSTIFINIFLISAFALDYIES